MNIQLIQGAFDYKDAVELVSQLIQVKIKFHENKINQSASEEDIKYRESKIKRLQNLLFELRTKSGPENKVVQLQGMITVE